MDNGQRVDEVRAVYRDPARLFGRSSVKLGADLVVVAIATLDEVARLRELVEPLVRALGQRLEAGDQVPRDGHDP